MTIRKGNFNLFYLFIFYVLYKYWYTLLEEDQKKGLKCDKSSSDLILKTSYALQ